MATMVTFGTTKRFVSLEEYACSSHCIRSIHSVWKLNLGKASSVERHDFFNRLMFRLAGVVFLASLFHGNIGYRRSGFRHWRLFFSGVHNMWA